MAKCKTDLFGRFYKKDTNLSILIIMCIVVTAILGLLLGNSFFSVNNFQTMAFQVPEFGFLAIAMGLSMLTGGIELSVVANANLAGIIAAYILSGNILAITGSNNLELIFLAILSAVIISTLCGLFNGILIAKFSVPPLLATLGTMLFFSGIGMTMTNGQSIGIMVDGFIKIGTETIFQIPVIFILFLIVLGIIYVLLSKTIFGQKVYLLGENRTALKFSGINVEKILIEIYTLAGFLAGISAVIMVSRVNSARVGFGDSYQLQAILVAVLGGIDPNGGKGNILGIFFGIIILQFLQSSFTIWNFTPYSKKLIWGFMILIVMFINYYISSKENHKKHVLKIQEAQ